MTADGYIGIILYADLTARTLREKPIPDEWKRQYLGGRGLGVALVSGTADPLKDPLNPDMPLVVATGPLTGSGMPLGSRYDVIAKSPLTGTLSSANAGGRFGTELKRAGYDAIVITGSATSSVILRVQEGDAALVDGTAYRGMTTTETCTAIKSDFGEKTMSVAAIGPAGELRSRMACIINDGGRAAGRGGLGAVMGAKNLKAIAVQGERKIAVADPASTRRVSARMRQKLKESGITTGGLHTHGTASVVPVVNRLGILPTRNFQQGWFSGAAEVSGERMSETILIRRTACYRCMVGCGRYTSAGGEEGEGPEYETIFALGTDCGIDDLTWIARANYLCNELGLDTISTGSTIACAMEMSEKGYLRESIKFGDGEAMFKLVNMIGRREGIGKDLAEGSLRFASRHGHPELSMSVKGLEIPGYDPRGLHGLGLNYATSVRGGCHVYGNMGYPEMSGFPVKLDPYATAGKAEWTIKFQNLAAVIDSAGLCMFLAKVLWIPDFLEMISAVTGFDLNPQGLLLIGERIWNLQKLFNIRAGIRKDQDALPPRFLNEPLRHGPAVGQVWNHTSLIGEYYGLRGWDGEGMPHASKLAELGIPLPVWYDAE